MQQTEINNEGNQHGICRIVDLEANMKAKLQEYIGQLDKLKQGITVKRGDIAFKSLYRSMVNISIEPELIGDYEYRSHFLAKTIGHKAFVSICYSQIDDLILEKITHYRDELKPYYTTDSNSVYAGKNKKISDLLREIHETVGAGRLPSDFCTVDVFPDTNGTFWKMLNRGELISNDYIGIVKRKFDYSASDYKTYIDCCCTTDYRGKYVYYYNACDASIKLGKDLGNALEYASSDIEDSTLVYIEDIVNSYNRNLKNCLDKKIELIKNLSFN